MQQASWCCAFAPQDTMDNAAFGVSQALARQVEGDPGPLDPIVSAFQQTFLQGDRWQIMGEGLATTITIAVCSGVVGLLIGLLTVWLQYRKGPIASRLVAIYQWLLGGVPIVIVLMVTYYLVLGHTNLPGEVVAIVAFALSFGSRSGAVMWAAVRTVDRRQEESGLALGYTRTQVFWRIVLSQASERFLPELVSLFTSLIKDTSIVGYIAVMDLTRATDFIKSKSMDAFLPLIASAVIYFLLCFSIAYCLNHLLGSFLQKSRPKQVRGIRA